MPHPPDVLEYAPASPSHELKEPAGLSTCCALLACLAILGWWAAPPPGSWIGPLFAADAVAFGAAMCALALRRRAATVAMPSAAVSLALATAVSAAIVVVCYRGYVTVPARSETALGFWQRLAYIAATVVAGPATLIAAIGTVRALRERRRNSSDVAQAYRPRRE